MAEVYMTREEMLTEIFYCRLVNSRLRRNNRECVVGFSWALSLCLAFILLTPFICIYRLSNFPTAMGIFIGIAAACLILAGICIYFIISSAIGLKKCDKMDQQLNEKELKLKQTKQQKFKVSA